MHLSAVDQMANNGSSVFHRAGVPSKLLLVLVLLVSIIGTGHIIYLGVLIGFITVLLIVSRAQLKEIVHLLLYPAVFSSLFALFKLQESLTAGIIVILRGTGAALATLFLLATTPWIEIFAFLSAYLPGLLVDIFLFTYRSFFILADRLGNLLRSIRLRGGYHSLNPLMNIKNMASVVGLLILNSFEMSERMYKIYQLRGYTGGIPVVRDWWKVTYTDGIVIVLSLLIVFGTVIMWRLW